MKNNENILIQAMKNNKKKCCCDNLKINQKQYLQFNKHVNIDQKMLQILKAKYNIVSNLKSQKPLIKREGDWICKFCNNLNFAFRKECNRCKLVKNTYNYNCNNC